MGYFFGCGNACNEGGGGSGGGSIGKYIAVALSAGDNDNVNPGSDWPTGYGRLDLEPDGAANLNSLVAGIDGQLIILRNASATETVTIPVGASGAAPFTGPGAGTILPPLAAMPAVYYAGGINNWVLVQ